MRVSPRGLVIRALVVVAVCAALGLGGILDPTHALLSAFLLLAAVLVQARRPPQLDEGWADHSFGSRDGGRGDVSDLSWQVFGEGRQVSARIVRRTRDLATARLDLLGVDAHDPARRDEVERLLGASVVAGLGSDELPTARTLQTWLDAIDALGDERTTR